MGADRPMRVLLTGGSGLLGRSLLRAAAGAAVEMLAPARCDLALTDRGAVALWCRDERIDAVIHAAARVGGIQANIDDPSGFLADNIRLNDGVIMGAHQAGVGRLIFVGSSCMYPAGLPGPLVEEDLLRGPPEPTNEGYALSKIVGARLCAMLSRQYPGRAYRTVVPCNLFGTDDHFGAASSHLVAAAIAKIVAARDTDAATVEIWGSGTARREFLEADVLACFVLTLLPRLDSVPALLNIGAGRDHTVDAYYRMIADLAGYEGRFVHDPARPEGVARKLMSSARAEALGYRPPADPRPGLARAIAAHEAALRAREEGTTP